MSGTIMVTCATGELGKLVTQSLLTLKVPPKDLVICVRDPKKQAAVDFAAKGIAIRQADFSDPKSLATAMTKIQTLMFISSGSLEKRTEQHANVLKAAKDAGTVKHIVYTSFLKCSKFILTPDHVTTEEALLKTGIPYTIFRNTFYMELIPMFLGDALKTGTWNYPAGNAKANFAAKGDIADGLAKVLTGLKPHVNKTYEIVAGKSYTFKDIAAIIAKISGKPCVYNSIPVADYKSTLKTIGLPEAIVNLSVSSAETIAAGQLDITNDALEKILGHKPKTLEQILPTLLK